MADGAFKHYINRDAVERLAQAFADSTPGFDDRTFVREACRGLEPLEFTGRTRHVAAALDQVLSGDKKAALAAVERALPPALGTTSGMFSERYWLWPLSDYVRDYGGDDVDAVLQCCYHLTQRFTAEFAIRPLLQTAPEAVLQRLQTWTSDPSPHVRRLCSEGTRPRLPWASRLNLPRRPVQKILTALNRDSETYVRKSVANHLNDLGKEDPEWLLTTLESWQKRPHEDTEWIIRHALRSLIKAGDARALALVGVSAVKLERARLAVRPKRLAIGESVTARLRFDYAGEQAVNAVIDWIVHYARPSGAPSRKVFKGKAINIAPGRDIEITKQFDLVPRRTRSLHAGRHRIEAQVNGEIVGGATFNLTA